MTYQLIKKERKFRYAVFKVDVGNTENIIPDCQNGDRDIGRRECML